MRSPYLLAVHAFVFNSQGKVLLLRRANTGYQDGWFSVPAGHVEGREWVKDAMERELQEEVGLKASIQAPVHVMQRLEDQERIDYFYEIRKWEGQITNCEPGKCSELAWFLPSALPAETIPYIRQALENVQRQQPFSLFGQVKYQG